MAELWQSCGWGRDPVDVGAVIAAEPNRTEGAAEPNRTGGVAAPTVGDGEGVAVAVAVGDGEGVAVAVVVAVAVGALEDLVVLVDCPNTLLGLSQHIVGTVLAAVLM